MGFKPEQKISLVFGVTCLIEVGSCQTEFVNCIYQNEHSLFFIISFFPLCESRETMDLLGFPERKAALENG